MLGAISEKPTALVLPASIRRFNADSGAFETCAFPGQGGDPLAGVDFPIRAGEGYLLSSRVDGTVTLPGCED